MNTRTKTILGILLFVLLMGAAYFTYHALSSKYKPNNGQQSPQESSQLGKLKTPASDFTVLDQNGKAVKLSDFYGKPIVLNFWASWCPPCKRELPGFEKMYQENKAEINFLMVDLVDGQRETLDMGKKYVSDNRYTFPVYYDVDQDAAYVYRINSIPVTYLIDKDGKIVQSFEGAIEEQMLKDAIAELKK